MWDTTLRWLHAVRQELMSGLGHIEVREVMWEKQHWKGTERDQKLVFEEVEKLCKRLNINSSSSELLRLFKQADTQNRNYLDFEDFRRFVQLLKSRPEIDRLYKKLRARGGGVFDFTIFQRFMREKQKSNLTQAELQAIFDHSKPTSIPTSTTPSLWVSARSRGRALLHSCRSVELDIYDGDQPTEPQIFHGKTFTFTSKVSLREVCHAIVKYGFVASPYPIIISAEVHCGLAGQDTIARIMGNPGFCYLTFNTTAQASSVLAQINNPGNGAPVTMPNSSKPFVLNWASAVHSASPASNAYPQPTNPALQQYPKEYSIFVGDLAPETSNSDLVAVFPCKSAKIMLDPVTGVSRGYGFVRFTDEADQQRALIEMHGLYCLSRPMRISPATAKYKAPPVAPSLDLPQVQFPPSGLDHQPQPQPVTIALPLPSSNLTKSVSVPMAAATSNSSLNTNNNGVSSSSSGSSLGGSTLGGSNSSNSLISGGSTTSASSSGFGSLTSEDMLNLPNSVLVQIAQQYASGETAPIKVNGGSSITQQFAQDAPNRQSFGQQSFGQGEGGAPRYTISEESWKHHAQARAILGNLIGPNGEQLTSTDPYNTTVFVGGLSPLISEETLRTFFAPLLHLVKVPVGKHCGFVQFVRKADAERAIEKMQGFPIGGSRICLSWGRSQYKAAQAAAQAAQAASLQTEFPTQVPLALNMMTQEQAIQLLQKLNLQGYLNYIPGSLAENVNDSTTSGGFIGGNSNNSFSEGKTQQPVLVSRDEQSRIFEAFPSTAFPQRPEVQRTQSSFALFSPDPNGYVSVPEPKRDSFSRSEGLPHPSKAYAPGFFPCADSAGPQVPHGTTHSWRALAFGVNRAPGRPEAAISRPPSGQTIGPQTHVESEMQELDAMHDLNGTLASLDLDRPSWKSQPPESSGSSCGSRCSFG
ncbi:putative RNA-binding protein C23E6.01c [Hypsizygus marmoreus]|uniref:RNA-binding protein C23E6.01c n=1 Tax=Hypsizygus marmoreus TaxID=39966 RepID=A0A369K1J5_HYPMA|nr:putative RNA-binding protein C23E6.01c [Hypsizygus marmoreus]